MSMSMKIDEGDTLTVYLEKMLNSCDDTGKKIRKIVSLRIKSDLVTQLRAMKYIPRNKDGSTGKRQREIHMADDVHITNRKDRLGYEVTRINGGKQTGTLWHILNDGNYGHPGNHFMDNTLSKVDDFIDKTIDEEMRKAGF